MRQLASPLAVRGTLEADNTEKTPLMVRWSDQAGFGAGIMDDGIRLGQQRESAAAGLSLQRCRSFAMAKGINGNDDERRGSNQGDAQHAPTRPRRGVAETQARERPPTGSL